MANPTLTDNFIKALKEHFLLGVPVSHVLDRLWTDKILHELPSQPFSDEEVAALTDGELSNSLNFVAPSDKTGMSIPTKASVGRNDQCPCGSGKKFKKCC